MEKLNSQIVIYKDHNGDVKIDVRFDGDTVWLTQDAIAKLYDKGRSTVTEHITNIFDDNELNKNSVCRDFRRTGTDNKDYLVKYYSLELIIAVGYRVKSPEGISFRKWATERLSEYIVKGFILDDERLKNPDVPFDYFEELTRRIADIRSSEKRFYRKITDIYSTSVDYDPTSDQSVLFFKTVQNKVHYAITGNTAAEIVAGRMDANKKNLGLTNFRGAKPTKDEVTIAKNYLDKEELLALNNLVEQYLVFAEGQAMRRVPMTMNDWIEKLHGFLKLNGRDILKDAGKISHELAMETAEKRFDEYKQIEAKQDVDFDEAALRAIESAKKRRKS